MTPAPWDPPPFEPMRRFWESTARHVLSAPWCPACAAPVLYPRELCNRCHQPVPEWRDLSGRGTVYACGVEHRAWTSAPGLEVPYVVALVDLDEGGRLLSNVVGPVDRVQVGTAVEVVWADGPHRAHRPAVRGGGRVIHTRWATVQIYDTDASGLIFFAAPLRWFAEGEEEYMAETGLLEVLGHRRDFTDAGPMAPTRAYEVSLDRPLRFRDRFEQRTWLSRVGTTSYTISHLIVVDGEVRVRGAVHRVTVTEDAGGALVPVPAAQALQRFVVEAE